MQRVEVEVQQVQVEVEVEVQVRTKAKAPSKGGSGLGRGAWRLAGVYDGDGWRIRPYYHLEVAGRRRGGPLRAGMQAPPFSC